MSSKMNQRNPTTTRMTKADKAKKKAAEEQAKKEAEEAEAAAALAEAEAQAIEAAEEQARLGLLYCVPHYEKKSSKNIRPTDI